MPELPEVETVVRQLNKLISGRTISKVNIHFNARNFPAEKEFITLLTGKVIKNVERRAKVIIFNLSDELAMIAHLKMSGKFFVQEAGIQPNKHCHVVLELDDGRQVFWHDVRKFGYLKIMTNLEVQDWFLSKKFGPEPLLNTFTPEVFKRQLMTRPKSKIKATLLDQTIVAGIGNIYDVEALWRSSIHPLRVIETLSDAEIERLHYNIVAILKESISANGTSSDDFLDTTGKKGNFQDQLVVYGRENTPCKKCQNLLEKIKINGRGTVFCPSCQK